jgi:hypothetical protein
VLLVPTREEVLSQYRWRPSSPSGASARSSSRSAARSRTRTSSRFNGTMRDEPLNGEELIVLEAGSDRPWFDHYNTLARAADSA